MSATGSSSDLAGKAAGGRRLIAVVYADMVGYSRLIGLDDAGTLRRLRTLRRALIDPAIREHGGKVVQTGGDSLLVAFDSLDGAVRCAVKVQQQVPVYDGDQPPDRRIRFRVGINIGDVIPHGTDLHGDGVNIAARLEAESPVGGICVSRAVHDHVRDRLDLPFEAIGPLALKNIARPVEAFVLRLDPGAAEAPAAGVTTSAVQPAQPSAWVRSRAALLAAVVGLLLCGALGAGWWLYRGTATAPKAPEATLAAELKPISPPATTQAFTPPDVGLAKAPRLSIVVLPFENLSDDRSEDYLAEGITEDVTTDLSRVPGMFVIARQSAYSYQGKATDVRKVGEELGVRYVLEGSVRKLGDMLRVNAQLIATETDAHLWADRFDQQVNDLSAGQDAIVRRIGQTLSVALADIESARSRRERPTNPDAFDLILRARSLNFHPMGPRENAEQIALYDQALRLDPTSALAMTGLADALIEPLRAGDELERAAKLLADAAAINPNGQSVLGTTGLLLLVQGHYTEAISAYQRVLSDYPNADWAYNQIANCLTDTGRAEEAIPMIESAIRLNPRSGYNWSRYGNMGFALLLLGRDEESIVWTQRALAANPNNDANDRAQFNLRLAAAHARLGQLDEAHRAIAEANRIWTYDTVRDHYPQTPSSRVLLEQQERNQAALRLAGERDHADEDADFGVAPDDKLHADLAGLTPTTVPGATTIRTAELERLLAERKPIVIDPLLYSWGRSIPGAVGLNRAGWGGSTSDATQGRLRQKMQELAKGDRSKPIVAVGWNSERFDGRNLALRLVALGYTQVYWYRGGREAWEVNGQPETEVDVQDR
jgi:adenylate cyclase